MNEVEIEGWRLNDGMPLIVVVVGPDRDGDFGLLTAGGEWNWASRFVIEDLIAELQRRLALRG